MLKGKLLHIINTSFHWFKRLNYWQNTPSGLVFSTLPKKIATTSIVYLQPIRVKTRIMIFAARKGSDKAAQMYKLFRTFSGHLSFLCLLENPQGDQHKLRSESKGICKMICNSSGACHINVFLIEGPVCNIYHMLSLVTIQLWIVAFYNPSFGIAVISSITRAPLP